MPTRRSARSQAKATDAVAVQRWNLKTGRLNRMNCMEEREGPALFSNRLIWEVYREELGV